MRETLFKVECDDDLHTIVASQDGRLIFNDHDRLEIHNYLTMTELGGRLCGCAEFLRSWQARRQPVSIFSHGRGYFPYESDPDYKQARRIMKRRRLGHADPAREGVKTLVLTAEAALQRNDRARCDHLLSSCVVHELKRRGFQPATFFNDFSRYVRSVRCVAVNIPGSPNLVEVNVHHDKAGSADREGQTVSVRLNRRNEATLQTQSDLTWRVPLSAFAEGVDEVGDVVEMLYVLAQLREAEKKRHEKRNDDAKKATVRANLKDPTGTLYVTQVGTGDTPNVRIKIAHLGAQPISSTAAAYVLSKIGPVLHEAMAVASRFTEARTSPDDETQL